MAFSLHVDFPNPGTINLRLPLLLQILNHALRICHSIREIFLDLLGHNASRDGVHSSPASNDRSDADRRKGTASTPLSLGQHATS